MTNKVSPLDDQQFQNQSNTTDARNPSRARHGSIIDLWATVDKARLEQDAHIIPLADLFQRFHTSHQGGLPTDSVPEALVHFGSNKLTPPKPPNYFWLLFKELFMGFNTILWVAGILAFLAYKPFAEPNPSITNLALGVVLILVVTFNSILNVYQQIKSIKIVAHYYHGSA